jgi:hypothetical chaperone protein
MPLSQPRPSAVGIDFGTTNSSIAVCAADRRTELVAFPASGGATTVSYRSVLYMDQLKEAGKSRVHSWTGPLAIARYLADGEKGRFIQSLKSHLASRSLTGTAIFGRHYALEALIARILADLRQHAEARLGASIHAEGRAVMVGRPVRFVGAETEADDAFALERLRQSFALAGYERVEFELEPIAAAYAYGSTLDHDELLLIGDFGGGTSDFSLITVGPGMRHRSGGLLGSKGLGLAGDAFDARIIRKLVSPALGADSMARSLNKTLPAVPAWIYANLERWHYLSFLRTREVAELVKSAHARSLEPEKIEALMSLIEEDLGYQLHAAVQRVKVELSRSEAAEFRFHDGSMDLSIAVTRAEFEAMIADQLLAIENCVLGLFADTGIAMGEVDRVFLTGGTSFVPAVRGIFERSFGADRVRTGEAFTSVARGLALRAQESAALADI